jgi:hypothetical protein
LVIVPVILPQTAEVAVLFIVSVLPDGTIEIFVPAANVTTPTKPFNEATPVVAEELTVIACPT